MSASTRAEIVEALDRLEAGVDLLCELSFDVLDGADGLPVLDRIERVTRKLRAPGHLLIGQLAASASPAQLGGTVALALANRLHITKAEADRRVAEAADLGPRRTLTGQPLQPCLPATAAAQRHGRIGSGHVAVIRTFFKKLPDSVEAADREKAEQDLALNAEGFRPDELSEYARVLKDCLKPNGDFSEEPHRDRTRGITIGRQQSDGMSPIRGHLSPQCRAALEPILAKLAAPGMCNPADAAPIIKGTASAEAVDRDTRGLAQRNHDALQLGLFEFLASKELGRHHGLPTTIVITTTLAELEAGAGRALTTGGTLLPMADVLRLAGAAHHYLAVFDKDKTLALYHGKRLASVEQRLVLLARDRGCTRPGCHVPGYWTQVHHVQGWLAKRRTDIDELTLACGPDNRMAELRKYVTRRNAHGHTEWLPPPHLDHGQPRVNCMHHPERAFRNDDEPAPRRPSCIPPQPPPPFR